VGEAVEQVEKTNGTHASFSWLREIFKECLQEVFEGEQTGDIPDIQQKRDQPLRVYLLYLVGITLFTVKVINYVDVTYLRYF